MIEYSRIEYNVVIELGSFSIDTCHMRKVKRQKSSNALASLAVGLCVSLRATSTGWLNAQLNRFCVVFPFFLAE